MNGLIVGLISSLMVSSIIWLFLGLDILWDVEMNHLPDNLLLLVFIVMYVTFAGIIFGIYFGFLGESNITQRINFNQGFHETTTFGLISGLSIGLIAGLSLGLISELVVGSGIELTIGLSISLNLGLILEQQEPLKHVILRLVLQRQKLAPRRFDKFLLYAIDRRLMRRVGGSAIFIHRYILEYFADYWNKNYASEFSEK